MCRKGYRFISGLDVGDGAIVDKGQDGFPGEVDGGGGVVWQQA